MPGPVFANTAAIDWDQVITEAELAATHGRDERLRVDQFRPAVRMYYEVVKTLSGADSDDIRQ
ncbi:MAG TPA: hypothetical protein VF515_06320 [Candidatus Binatia bacterium]